MKQTLKHITVASVATLVAYIASYFVWGAIIGGVENQTLRFFLVALVTTIAYPFILLYFSKIKNSDGEDEVVADYKEKPYVSFADDLRCVIKREAKTLICIAVIILICFALNTLDAIMFGTKTFSNIALLFVALCMFANVIKIEILGYLLSAVQICAFYILVLLFYRKRTYDYWMKNNPRR